MMIFVTGTTVTGESEIKSASLRNLVTWLPAPHHQSDGPLKRWSFEVGDDLTKEQYCALLDTIKTKYGFPPTAKIKLDVGEFNASVCD